LLSYYRRSEFASPYRSTIPLLSLFKDRCDLFDALARDCGLDATAGFAFEYKTHSMRSSGRASQTDVVLQNGTRALAIEAKWTEPPYESVKARLKRLPSNSQRKLGFSSQRYFAEQREFAEGWLDYLRKATTQDLDLDDFTDLAYQVLHRGASACAVSKNPALLYLHFAPPMGPEAARAAGIDYYANALMRLHSLLKYSAKLRVFVAEVTIRPTPAFHAIANLQRGSADTAVLVRQALLSKALFEFGQYTVRRISN